MIPPGTLTIFFDAVGTLIYPEPPAEEVYTEIGQRHGSRYSAREIAWRFAAAFAREEEIDWVQNLRTSEARERRRWQTIVRTVLGDVRDPAGCFEGIYQHFAQPRAWRCDPDVERVLQALAGRGYRLGLASNYDRRLRRVAAGLPCLCGLQPVVISSEVGWRKPAAEFYATLCRSVDLPAEKILYIGDDPANDYAGAVAAGLHAVLFDPGGKQQAFPGPRLMRWSDLG